MHEVYTQPSQSSDLGAVVAASAGAGGVVGAFPIVYIYTQIPHEDPPLQNTQKPKIHADPKVIMIVVSFFFSSALIQSLPLRKTLGTS